jgi:hypothetical protein
LGVGFAFIGQEYRVSVGDEDFYIDLLFSHRYLQCLVAFELKIVKFQTLYGAKQIIGYALNFQFINVDSNTSYPWVKDEKKFIC